jgi:hypothetical protein
MVLAALLQPAIGVTHPTFVHENATSLWRYKRIDTQAGKAWSWRQHVSPKRWYLLWNYAVWALKLISPVVPNLRSRPQSL